VQVVFLSNPCKVNYPKIALIQFIKADGIFDVRNDVIVKLFIVRGVQLVKIVTLLWNIVVLFTKHFLDSISFNMADRH